VADAGLAPRQPTWPGLNLIRTQTSKGSRTTRPNPETRYTSREAVQLAFVATIQQLPPRQRAAILLCDVLGWGGR